MDFTPYLSAAIMLLGILVGTLISPKIQHRMGTEYNRKNIIFQKKLEYFEYIMKSVEKNKKLYHNLIHKIEDSKTKSQINNILDELKENRKKFLIMSSSLYFNTRIFSEKITLFVKIEKDIFNEIFELKGTGNNINKEKKEETLESLKENLKRLNKKGEEILSEMKKQLLI